MPGEAEQPPRAAVPDRDRKDAGVFRGRGVAKEDGGGNLQGEVLGCMQPPWVPGAQRPAEVSGVCVCVFFCRREERRV